MNTLMHDAVRAVLAATRHSAAVSATVGQVAYSPVFLVLVLIMIVLAIHVAKKAASLVVEVVRAAAAALGAALVLFALGAMMIVLVYHFT